MAGTQRSLDIEDRQVAIDFFDDQVFQWHVRVLLISGGGGRWIWVTPDHEVQYGDLSSHRVVPIPRGSPYPARLQGNLYAFDEFGPGELEALRIEAAELAAVLGLEVGRPTGGGRGPRWVVADPGHEGFGTVIETNVAANPEKFVQRGSSALAALALDGGEEWTFCENVAEADHQKWLDEKRSGPGRDERVCPVRRLGEGGPRRQSLDQALSVQRMVEYKDWPFRGPRAVVELFEGIRASGLGFDAYANHYVSVSGVSPSGSAAHELKNLFSLLRHMSEYDQLDCSNLASAELAARRVVQIQRAIRRSAKHPDYSGLESMTATSLDETGGVVTTKFDEWVAQEQKVAAVIMKSQRQYAEERDAEAKKHREGEGAAGAGASGGRKK